MWKSIKQFIFESEETISTVSKITEDALAHYCEVCRKGFKNIGATKTHKRIKHKI